MRLSMGCFMGQEMRQVMVQRQEIVQLEPHQPLRNPELTRRVANHLDTSFRPFEEVEAESELLQRFKHSWQNYLDAPLIVHADAAISLQRNGCDGVVSIKGAGVPYGDIFEMMGHAHYKVDFSHHKRHMDSPTIDSRDLEELRKRDKIVITDIDMVSGKTARTVTQYLRENGVNVQAIYLGLSEWPGIKMKGPHLRKGTVNFRRLWEGSNEGLVEMDYFTQRVRLEDIIPEDLRVYAPNSRLWYEKAMFPYHSDNLKYAVNRVRRKLKLS